MPWMNIHHWNKCLKWLTKGLVAQIRAFNGTREEPTKCVYCDYGFYDKKSIMGHYDRNHQGVKFSLEWLRPSVAVCMWYCVFVGSEEVIFRHIACRGRHSKLVVNIHRVQVKIVWTEPSKCYYGASTISFIARARGQLCTVREPALELTQGPRNHAFFELQLCFSARWIMLFMLSSPPNYAFSAFII